jgi:hypothetical protein
MQAVWPRFLPGPLPLATVCQQSRRAEEARLFLAGSYLLWISPQHPVRHRGRPGSLTLAAQDSRRCISLGRSANRFPLRLVGQSLPLNCPGDLKGIEAIARFGVVSAFFLLPATRLVSLKRIL